MKYRFKKWEDGSTDPSRSINLSANKEITAYYEEVIVTGKVTFSGTVSAQAEEGETVSITVTKPDSTTEVITALTKADSSYSVDYENVPGNYKAKARVEEDALYTAAESDEVSFSIGKEPRTITLTVTPK